MSKRSAFQRARHFLWYRPVAPTLSLVLAPFTGFLLVLLLVLIGMVLDLAITRGVVHDVNLSQSWAASHAEHPQQPWVLQTALGKQGLGLQALAIRTQNRWIGDTLQWLVDQFPLLRNNYVYLITLTVSIIATAVGFSLISFLQKRTAAAAAVDAITRLRRSVHTHAYRLGALTLRQVSQGPVIGSTMRALDTLQEGLYAWFVRTVHEPWNLFWLVVFLVGVDCLHGVPWTSLILLASAALYWLVGSWIAATTRAGERRDAIKAAEGQTLLMESLSLHRLVKIYGMEQYNKNRLERLLHRQGSAVQSRWYWQFLSRHGRWLFLAILLPLLALALVVNLLDGQLRMIPLVMMLLAVGCIFLVLKRWQMAWHQVKKAQAAATGLFQLLDQETDVKQVVGAEFLPPMT
ncbi:MAG TPA: ABC transporter transmembrane domain-containing protein, partial [Gemmatales bacterium]|nr:ABC transporter transmembrane domain-containing protein [Gemmatales bacterium]